MKPAVCLSTVETPFVFEEKSKGVRRQSAIIILDLKAHAALELSSKNKANVLQSSTVGLVIARTLGWLRVRDRREIHEILLQLGLVLRALGELAHVLVF